MPKDRGSRQEFGVAGDHWDNTSTDEGAGKVYLVGGTIDNIDIDGGVDGSGDSLVSPTTFTTSTTGWHTVLSGPGSTTRLELRLHQAGNNASKPVIYRLRWASNAAFMVQTLPGNGGAFNQNNIGAYYRGSTNESLEVNLSTATDFTLTVWTKEI